MSIVSRLTRLIQRTTGVSVDQIEYDSEYREAEDEHEQESESEYLRAE